MVQSDAPHLHMRRAWLPPKRAVFWRRRIRQGTGDLAEGLTGQDEKAVCKLANSFPANRPRCPKSAPSKGCKTFPCRHAGFNLIAGCDGWASQQCSGFQQPATCSGLSARPFAGAHFRDQARNSAERCVRRVASWRKRLNPSSARRDNGAHRQTRSVAATLIRNRDYTGLQKAGLKWTRRYVRKGRKATPLPLSRPSYRTCSQDASDFISIGGNWTGREDWPELNSLSSAMCTIPPSATSYVARDEAVRKINQRLRKRNNGAACHAVITL